MEDKSGSHSTPLNQGDELLWTSRKKIRGVEMTISPNVSVWPAHSEELSKHDSGYCSFTPGSADSFKQTFNKRYSLCSTPQHTSCSFKNFRDNHTPNSEYLQAISEGKMSPVQHILPRNRQQIDHYFEAMDTSLYHEEMEAQSYTPGENHRCALELLELEEEKSIDFLENDACFSSTTPKDTGVINEPRDKLCEDDETEEFFSPEADMFSCKMPSPVTSSKGTTQKKVKRSSDFQRAAKKVTTINRVIKFFSLNGLEKLDFLYQLGVKKSFPFIVSKILGYLSVRDLDSVRVVSKTWNELFLNDFPSFNRWQLHRTAQWLMKENLASPTKAGSSGERLRPAPLSPLHNVSNHMNVVNGNSSPRQRSPPVSPESVRFRSFQKAVRSLRMGERVLPCPKCLFASTDTGNPIIQCPRSGCRHSFCVWCRNETLPDQHHDCPPQYTPRLEPRRTSNRVASIGSKRSKRNLRRLI